MKTFRRHYGAGPLHLLSLVTCAVLVAYVVSRLVASGPITKVAIWFAGAVVAHDLFLWPLYALADRAGVVAARRNPSALPSVPWINHLRVPAVLAGVLFAVSFPLVLQWSPGAYHAATGLSQAPFLNRWLLITGVAFAASAVLYAIRLARARRRLSVSVPDHEPRHRN